MKGKELLKVVTKTVISLSLSMFCITQSSSEKCNFASKKTMEKEKMKLLFYLKRGTQDKNGKSPIMGRISISRSMVQFSCKCACTPKLWDSRKQRLVGKSAEAVSVNRELDRLQVSVHQVYDSLSGKLNNTVTAGQVRELVFGLNSESQGLLHHTDEYIDRFRERVGIIAILVVLTRHKGELSQRILSAFILNFLIWLCIGVPIIISVFIWRSHPHFIE